MQKTVNFKKKLIASVIASTIGFSGAAFAQDDAEEIVVTGIKASLTRAMDIKRDAAGVVDAISAEDIGKMPDANLAESLQRISGVSIDRSNGEGSKVTVRGLDGNYNLVTVNGRQMPASSQSTGGASQTRSFDFANLASEGVAGVSVYKTGRSDIASGGMGAVIDIQTPHPLKTPGLKATVGVKAVLDSSSQKSDVTPEISGLFSNTFLDDTIGVAVAGSYQERNFGDRQAYTAGWFSHSATGNDWGELPASARPEGATLYANPINIGYKITESNRTRTNGQATFQYKPVESLTATADYIYVKQEVEAESHSMGAWFNRAEPMAITWSDGPNKYPKIYSETNPLSADGTEPKDFDFSAGLTNRQNELKAAGLNLQWEASDHLKLELDTHHSTSISDPGSKYGTENGFDAAAFVNYNPSVDYSGDFPVFSLKGQPGVAVNADPARVQITNNYFKKAEQDSAVDQTQIKAEYTIDESVLKAIRIGFNKAKISNASKWNVVDGQNKGSWNNTHQKGDVRDSLWHVDKLSNYFDASEVSRLGAQNEFVTFNFKESLAEGAKLYGVDTADAANPCVRDYCTTRTGRQVLTL